jgi:hypothetical protein
VTVTYTQNIIFPHHHPGQRLPRLEEFISGRLSYYSKYLILSDSSALIQQRSTFVEYQRRTATQIGLLFLRNIQERFWKNDVLS